MTIPISSYNTQNTVKPELINLLRSECPYKCITIALELIESLKRLHDSGYTHRTLSPEEVIIGEDKKLTFKKSTEELAVTATNEDIGIIGTPAYIPPERLHMQLRRSSWAEDDIYALGVIILHDIAQIPLPWREDYFSLDIRYTIAQKAKDAKYILTNETLPPSNVLKLLGYWMADPNPKTRLTSLEEAAEILRKSQSQPLDDAVCYTPPNYSNSDDTLFEKLKSDLKNPTLEPLLRIAADLAKQDSPYAYVRRKARQHNHKVFILPKNNEKIFLFLPFLDKKDKKANVSHAKIGRRAILIQRIAGVWIEKSCFVLTSNKYKDSLYYKMIYSRERAIHAKTADKEIFAQHIASCGFSNKPHKRLGIYECMSTLFDLADLDACPDCTWVTKQLQAVVKQLHELGLAHRDIKPENILVEGAKLRLCDPDFVVEDSCWKDIISFGSGTPAYMPDIRHKKGYSGSYCDDDLFAMKIVQLFTLSNQPSKNADIEGITDDLIGLKLRAKSLNL